MVEYITRDFLRKQAQSPGLEALVRKAEQRSPKDATFLSHSSKDSELLPGVIALLERHGASVYVDKKDESLPPYTSRETAQVLRERIAACRKFILLCTENSKGSRWVPWELGLSDGFKRQQHTAILPSPDLAHERQWAEREYLGVYDRIVHGTFKGHSTPVFMVWNQDTNEATELSVWLNS